MFTNPNSLYTLEEYHVNIKIKLAALWTSFMFLYIYIDYFHLYMPKTLKDIQQGTVFTFAITPAFLMIALLSVSIPAMMIFLSILLKPKINRLTNIIVASIYIPYTLFNLFGEAWLHMHFGAVVEVMLLCLIVRFAWKWPCIITS